jgi:hypothetical protein
MTAILRIPAAMESMDGGSCCVAPSVVHSKTATMVLGIISTRCFPFAVCFVWQAEGIDLGGRSEWQNKLI